MLNPIESDELVAFFLLRRQMHLDTIVVKFQQQLIMQKKKNRKIIIVKNIQLRFSAEATSAK